MSQFGERLRQQPRAANAAVEDRSLLGGRPAASGDGLASQVNDGVEAFQLLSMDLARLHVPTKLSQLGRSGERRYGMSRFFEPAPERSANEPVGAAEDDLHRAPPATTLVGDL